MSRALLLDENLSHGVARGLAAAGHDVLAVAQAAPGIDDRAVLALARGTGRALLTFDADFGDLIFKHGEVAPAAVLYFRVHPVDDDTVLALALAALAQPNEGCFIVVAREGLRSRAFGEPAADGRG